MVWIGVIAGILICLDLAIRIPCVRIIRKLFENSPPLKFKEGAAESSAERVSFETTNGLTLRGALYLPPRNPRGVIVFCPEWHGNHWLATEYCQGLMQSNYAVLAFDFRNQGESDCQPHYSPLQWVTHYEVDDVRAAIRYVEERVELKSLPLGLMGVSRGGGAALAAAALSPRVEAVVTDSAFSTDIMVDHYIERWRSIYAPSWYLRYAPRWHQRSIIGMSKWISQRRRNCRYFNLERVLPRFGNRPVLMIAGKRDSYVKPEVTYLLADHLGGQCDVWLVRKARHNMAREVDSEEYDFRVPAFFENHLREQAPSRRPRPASAVLPGTKPAAETRVARESDL